MSAQLLCLSVCFLRLRLPPVSLPACFPGQAKPSASLPSLPSCAVYALSLLCSPVKWVPHGAAGCSLCTSGTGARRTEQAPNTRKHTHGPKVQRSLPADLENATVWKWPLAQSKHPRRVLNWAQRLRAGCVLMLSDWLAALLVGWGCWQFNWMANRLVSYLTLQLSV